jgi:glycosyltransferase involved in cell wall biosynthesis
MRLLTIAHSSGMGGANISWLNVLRGFKNLGVEIKVIVSEKGLLSAELEKLGVSYEVVPFYYCVYPEIRNFKELLIFCPRLFFHEYTNYKATKQLLKIATEFHPDIIHCNGSVIDIGLAVANKLKIPHVWHLREYTDLDFGYHMIPTKRFYFNQIRKKSYSISITPSIFNHFSISSDRGKTIYNGIYSQDYNPTNSSKKNKFLYVGAVTENKGVTDLIEAYIQYRRRGGSFTLEIVGPYQKSYLDELTLLLKKAAIEDGVYFEGRVREVSNYMLAAKAIIVPSKNEGFGRITAEAMWHECLVVGRNTAGTKLQFDVGKNLTNREIGLRFNDIEELADHLYYVEKLETSTYLKFTQNAKKVVISKYSIETNVRETYNFLNSLISRYNKNGK